MTTKPISPDEQSAPGASNVQPPAGDPPPDLEGGTPQQLPDDHPLVKAFAATKAELATAKQKIKAIGDAEKTGLERLTDELAAARAEAATAATEKARFAAAVKYGLEGDDIDLLGDGTTDEIDARAKRLAERLTNSSSRKGTAPRAGNSTNPPVTEEQRFVRELFGDG